MIELGMPFSDPLADGGTIQAANMVALKNGITLKKTIKYVEEARAKGLTKPVILMGYANPFLRYGEAQLGEDCAKGEKSSDSAFFSHLAPWIDCIVSPYSKLPCSQLASTE